MRRVLTAFARFFHLERVTTVVAPEDWYKLFWVLMLIGFWASGYWVIKWAVLAALREFVSGAYAPRLFV